MKIKRVLQMCLIDAHLVKITALYVFHVAKIMQRQALPTSQPMASSVLPKPAPQVNFVFRCHFFQNALTTRPSFPMHSQQPAQLTYPPV
jgi:hypothetical protein